MAIPRKEFTDAQKAEIYKRDRATCCFSGTNLWLLDAPLRCGWQSDWADHKKPSSRGGQADIHTNGICASHTYNMKKRNNSADTTHLFEKGHPTELYYNLFGTPPHHIIERLQRLSNLQIHDWYFNRAVTWILNAIDDLWRKSDYTRTPDYWFDAAFKKLMIFRKALDQGQISSFEERKILQHANATQQTLLSLWECTSLEQVKRVGLSIRSKYETNSDAWHDYFEAEDDKHRRKAYDKACRLNEKLDAEIFSPIQADYQIRYGSL